MTPDDPRHGTTAGHCAGCRDTCCVDAKRRYDKHRRHERENGHYRRVPLLGFRRRIQALQAIGYSLNDISNETGIKRSNLSTKITRGQYVAPRTFKRLADAYDRMCMTPKVGGYSKRVLNCAKKNGWAVPLAWDNIDDPNETPKGVIGWNTFRSPDLIDDNVVDRILGGEWDMSCTRAEKEVVCSRFMANGGSSRELARVSGWKVERYWKREEAA